MNGFYKDLESFTFFMSFLFKLIFFSVILFNLDKLKTVRFSEVLIIIALACLSADVCGLHIIARSTF